MHILIISECYPTIEAPQYGIFIKQQADALKAFGTTYEVLIPHNTGVAGCIEKKVGADYFEVEYRTFRYNLLPRIAAGKYSKQLFELLSKKHYDAVSVHITGDAILQLTVEVCNRLSIPIVAHYHGLNVWEEYTTKHKYREKWYANKRLKVLRKVQAVVGVSQKVTDIVKTRFPFGNRCYTVYNGVSLEQFTPMNGRDNVIFQIIGVGNLISIKGFYYLIHAFARITAKFDNVELHIVGEGIEREALHNLTKELGLSEKVTFYGKLPYEVVAEQMRRSDLFVLPSFYEALGCVYLEAMACGVPAVGVRGMGIDEIIVDGENGFLVNPCDVDDLCTAIQRAIENQDVLSEIAQNAYRTAGRFTWKQSAEALNKIYQGICK